jgi:hypothetical protein
MEHIVSKQPTYVYSYTVDDKKPKSNKCACERCLFGEKNDDKMFCPTGIEDWCDFRMSLGYSDTDGGTFACVCFPIVFTLKLLFCFSCSAYNSCRNKCENTNNLNYMC